MFTVAFIAHHQRQVIKAKFALHWDSVIFEIHKLDGYTIKGYILLR